jgi:hypothetical protein
MSGEEHRKEDVFIIIFPGQRVFTCWPDAY